MEPVVGVLLAGGLGRRMGGGDKPLNLLGGKPLLAHMIERAAPQVDVLILNANGDTARFDNYNLPVIADVVEGFAGPLAGIHSALQWTQDNYPRAKWVVSFATDAPFFPVTMVEKFHQAQRTHVAQIVCAQSHGRDHPVFALWSVGLVDALLKAMVDENLRKIDLWTSRFVTHRVNFDRLTDPIDPFFNINRPEDLVSAEQWIENLNT